MDLGNTAYVILGMLEKSPKSGYEIKAKADVSTRFFWAISYGQIYPELKRLEEAGLVEGQDDPESGGRRRRIYSITETGRTALREWLTQPGDLHTELRHEGVLRFFFADMLGDDERLELVEAIRAKHAWIRAELQAMRPEIEAMCEENDDVVGLLTLETGIAYQELFMELCDRLERRLAEIGRPTATRGD